MDVKGAKALSERLAEAARNVEPLTREQRGIIRKQIDALMRERLDGLSETLRESARLETSAE